MIFMQMKGEYNQKPILNLLIPQVQPPKLPTAGEGGKEQERRVQVMKSFVVIQKRDRKGSSSAEGQS